MSILDTIDGALRDYEASGDAMRWVPEEKREAPQAVGFSFDQAPLLPVITIDTSQFELAFRQIGEALSRFLRPFADFAKSMVPIVETLNGVRAERVSAMHREYRRRAVARRRRR